MAKKKDYKECHVTLLEEQHNQLRELAKLQGRSMRNTVAFLVKKELAKEKGKR